MNSVMKLKHWIGYILFGAVVTVIFLYALFPGDVIVTYVTSKVEKDLPRWTVDIGSARMILPLGVKLTGVTMSLKGKEGASLKADSVTLRPSLRGLLTGSQAASLKARMYGGTVKADMTAGDAKAGKALTLAAKVDDVDVGKCSLLESVMGRRVTGVLTGTADFKGLAGRSIDGDGTAKLTLREGAIPLAKDVLGFESISFDTLDAEIELKRKTLQVQKISVAGSQMKGDFSGRVTLRDDVLKSALSLRGTMDLIAMGKKLTMTLGGTLDNPVPRFR